MRCVIQFIRKKFYGICGQSTSPYRDNEANLQ